MTADHPARVFSVFVDSSVLFAAALSSSGSARDLVLLATRGEIELILSSLVLAETERNLAKKAPRALPQFDALRDSGIFRISDPDCDLVRDVAAFIEPKDAPIVAGAIAARVRALATYDRRHLLSQAVVIQEHFGLKVDAPDQVLGAFQNESRGLHGPDQTS